MPAYTADLIALGIVAEGREARDDGPFYLHHPAMTERGIVIALATALVESNLTMYANHGDPASLTYPHDAISRDYNSVGVFQQRAEWWGTVKERMDVRLSAAMFYHQLARRDYNNPRNSPGSQAQEVQGSAFPGRYDERMAQAQAIYDRLSNPYPPAPKKETPPVEKVLNYPRGRQGDYDGISQTKFWDCGPASVQAILAAAGVFKSEDWLINEANAYLSVGDRIDTDGTNHAGLLCPLLNRLLPGSGYTEVWVPRTSPQVVDTLWGHITRSIDAGRGVLLNFEVPPWQGVQTTRGSKPPPYPKGSTTYHYTAGLGYAVDSDGSRHVWIADPAAFGGITGYWVSVEHLALLLVPHAYAWASTAQPISKPAPVPPAPQPAAPSVAELSAKVERLSNALSLLLAIIERTNPEILQSYLDAAKGK